MAASSARSVASAGTGFAKSYFTTERREVSGANAEDTDTARARARRRIAEAAMVKSTK